MVVTLRLGKLTVSEDPETAWVAEVTGCTVPWVPAGGAVMWNEWACPDKGWPEMAVVCVVAERLMATITTRPGRVLSVLTYVETLAIALETAATEVSPKLLPALSKSLKARNPAVT